MAGLTQRKLRLSELLGAIADIDSVAESIVIQGISSDSRALKPGDLFIAQAAQAGGQYHGLDFYDAVRAAGAAAIVWQPPYARYNALVADAHCPLFAISDLQHKASLIADRFYDYPAKRVHLLGITGTDGKTSCSYFISQALHAGGANSAILGTTGYGLYGQSLLSSRHTTGDAVTVRRQLAELIDQGARYIAMEVSSHALAQERVAGLDFDIAILTNLTRDHLDYHGDLDAYAAAKRRLFTDYKPHCSVINGDDVFGRSLIADLDEQIIIYSLGLDKPSTDSLGQPLQGGTVALVWGNELRFTASGLSLQVSASGGNGALTSGLLGRFNASNLLATMATLLALDVPFRDALEQVAQVANAPGRMECFGGCNGQPLVVVDYAHTPYALEQVLCALREHVRGKLWCVFGCGGDRDPGKRPLMGVAAERWADRVIVTDDNPRGEPAEQIIDQIIAGMQCTKQTSRVPGREQAISIALSQAQADDIVLVAGKGHETHQIIGNQYLPFSDRAWVEHCLAEHAA